MGMYSIGSFWLLENITFVRWGLLPMFVEQHNFLLRHATL